jgi:phage tail-like protein
MVNPRPSPYHAFNFLVSFGNAATTNAGFQEVKGLSIEVNSTEYRVGNSTVNYPIKLSGLTKVTEATFTRGLIGALDLYQLIDAVRTGIQTPQDVHVQLQDEAHKPVLTFTLKNARPIRYTAPTFNAKTGTEVAIEELVLAMEDLLVE